MARSPSPPRQRAASVAQAAREPQDVWVQPRTVCTVLRQSRQHTRPSADCARAPQAEKKAKVRSEGLFVSSQPGASYGLDAQVPQGQRFPCLVADYATNCFCSSSLRHNARIVANSR
jgi:hypothetical protein